MSRMMARLALLMVATLAAASTAEDAKPLLIAARAKIASNLEQLPNYTCVETLQRASFDSGLPRSQPFACPSPDATPGGNPSRVPAWKDRLRLEVTVMSANETFSWPRAARFASGDKTEFAGDGTIGTGDFGGFLNGIFGYEGAAYEYLGQRESNGISLADFSYHVPLEKSGYTVHAGLQPHLTGYRGTFSVESGSAELRHISVFVSNLPDDTKLCTIHSEMEYHSVRVAGAQFRLPERSDLKLLYADGKEFETSTTYSDCKKFSAESKLSFDGSAGGPVVDTPSKPVPAVSIPTGLALDIRLASPIESTEMAAGDSVVGVVARALKSRDGQVLIPKDAVVHGRIMRMREYLVPVPCFVVGVRFESVEIDGHTVPLWLTANPQDRGAMVSQVPSMSTGMGLGMPVDPAVTQFTDPRREVATLVFPDVKHVFLKAGYTTHWTTAPAR